MTLPNPGSWQAILEKEAPQLFEDVSAVRDHVMADGALSLKVKVLMTMLCDALLAHPEGVANIANRALSPGPSTGPGPSARLRKKSPRRWGLLS